MQLTEKRPDDLYIKSLIHMLHTGSNFTEISLGYGHGNAVRLFKRAFDASGSKREDIFITHSLYPRDFRSFEDVAADVNDFYVKMQTTYADSTLVTQSLILRFGESAVYGFLHELIDAGKTRYVSLSNASPAWIKKFSEEFGDYFVAHEGHVSFEVRLLQDKGVLALCENLGVANVIWRPLRRSKSLINSPELLIRLSHKYGKTRSQIILNWMVRCGWKPMVFSTNLRHVDENMAAISFEMEPTDYEQISQFRRESDAGHGIDWEGPGIDDDIVSAVSAD